VPREPEPFINVRDVALLLGMSEKWIYAQVHAGRMPVYRIGRSLRFRRSEVARWAEGNRWTEEE